MDLHVNAVVGCITSSDGHICADLAWFVELPDFTGRLCSVDSHHGFVFIW